MTASNDVYHVLIEAIIQKQATVLGLPVAVKRARNVEGLTVSDDGIVQSMSEATVTLSALVEEFKKLSGNVGVQFCKQAAAGWATVHPNEKLPLILQ